MIYSWQKEAWTQLAATRAQLPHALVLHGRAGLGKSQLAVEFAQSLLCEHPAADGFACGKCPACGWFTQGNHPDFRLVQPDAMAPEAEGTGEGTEAPAKKEKKKSEQIRVEQVRALQDFLTVGTHRGGLRIVILDPADSMNTTAQNALLKNLEEPPKDTLFLLITSRPQFLLPTVRSRCRAMAVAPPPPAESRQWLTEQGLADPDSALVQAGGAPLAALKMGEGAAAQAAFLDALQQPDADPIAIAQRFETEDAATVVNWLQRWVLDIFRQSQEQPPYYHPQRARDIERISARADLARLGRYAHDLNDARRLASHPLNAKLFLEDLLIRYRAATC